MRSRNTFNIISMDRDSPLKRSKNTLFRGHGAARKSSAQCRWGKSRLPRESAASNYAVRVICEVRFTRSFCLTAGNAHHTRRCGQPPKGTLYSSVCYN
jgi:hypothetical protein